VLFASPDNSEKTLFFSFFGPFSLPGGPNLSSVISSPRGCAILFFLVMGKGCNIRLWNFG
jgi:hypothetical protein